MDPDLLKLLLAQQDATGSLWPSGGLPSSLLDAAEEFKRLDSLGRQYTAGQAMSVDPRYPSISATPSIGKQILDNVRYRVPSMVGDFTKGVSRELPRGLLDISRTLGAESVGGPGGWITDMIDHPDARVREVTRAPDTAVGKAGGFAGTLMSEVAGSLPADAAAAVRGYSELNDPEGSRAIGFFELLSAIPGFGVLATGPLRRARAAAKAESEAVRAAQAASNAADAAPTRAVEVEVPRNWSSEAMPTIDDSAAKKGIKALGNFLVPPSIQRLLSNYPGPSPQKVLTRGPYEGFTPGTGEIELLQEIQEDAAIRASIADGSLAPLENAISGRAWRFKDGAVRRIPDEIPHDIIEEIKWARSQGKDFAKSPSGFIDVHGKFATSEEAFEIAGNAGQLRETLQKHFARMSGRNLGIPTKGVHYISPSDARLTRNQSRPLASRALRTGSATPEHFDGFDTSKTPVRIVEDGGELALDLPAMRLLMAHGADPSIPTMKAPARRFNPDGPVGSAASNAGEPPGIKAIPFDYREMGLNVTQRRSGREIANSVFQTFWESVSPKASGRAIDKKMFERLLGRPIDHMTQEEFDELPANMRNFARSLNIERPLRSRQDILIKFADEFDPLRLKAIEERLKEGRPSLFQTLRSEGFRPDDNFTQMEIDLVKRWRNENGFFGDESEMLAETEAAKELFDWQLNRARMTRLAREGPPFSAESAIADAFRPRIAARAEIENVFPLHPLDELKELSNLSNEASDQERRIRQSIVRGATGPGNAPPSSFLDFKYDIAEGNIIPGSRHRAGTVQATNVFADADLKAAGDKTLEAAAQINDLRRLIDDDFAKGEFTDLLNTMQGSSLTRAMLDDGLSLRQILKVKGLR